MITNTLILLLKLNIIVYVLSDMASFIAEVLFSLQSKNKAISLIQNLFIYVLSCTKCFGFWFTLIWTQDIFLASLTALIQVLIYKALEHPLIKT